MTKTMPQFRKRKNVLVVFESRGLLWTYHKVFQPEGYFRQYRHKLRGFPMRFVSPHQNINLVAAVLPNALMGHTPDYCVVVGNIGEEFVKQIADWDCPVEELMIHRGELCELPGERND
jgi:hypothetical protein